MRRNVIALALSALLFPLSVPAQAQQARRVYRVGFLSGGFPSTTGIEAMRRELRELGYVEGKNIIFEYRYAEAKRKTIPIVFLESISDPVSFGLVDSLAKPGGNITGFTTMATVLAGKRLEILKEAMPKLSRVAVLWNPKSTDNELQWKESQVAAHPLRLQLYSMEVSSPDKYESAFKQATKAGIHALAVTRYRLSVTYNKRLIEMAAKYRIPAIYFREDIVANGGLMSYGADEVEPFKRAAVMVDKILKGTKPADIPVEQSSKFEFVVNLKTAKQLGVTIPPNVLARVNRIIK
jgi:putative ABC transport system substrate-binding protein